MINLRESVRRTITEIGHLPVMFEHNFGAWDSHTNTVRKCLEIVRESDALLLFISDKAGTFYEEAQRTVTHLELMEAHRYNKTILVFVDIEVKAVFFSNAKGIIDEFIEFYKSENEMRIPNASDIVELLSTKDTLPNHIDPYVWFLIYDIIGKEIYVEDLALAVSPDWKTYFSDLLRRGLQLMPFKDAIETNEHQLEQYDTFYDLIINTLPSVNIAGIGNLRTILNYFMRSAKGDIVEEDYKYTKEIIGSFQDSSAVTLYTYLNDRMVLMEKAGTADGDGYYPLDDKDSFVALTYSSEDDQDQVFFKESKSTFYYCLRLPNYVMTFHFPCSDGWNSETFMTFKDSLIRVIIYKNALTFEYARLLIGGMQHEK